MNESHPDLKSEISAMYAADQSERHAGLHITDIQTLIENDKVRMDRALEIYEVYKAGEVLDGESLNGLAMIFQHGGDIGSIEKAFELAAAAASAGYAPAEWLMCASEDRLLMYQNKKQKWGTQFRKGDDGKWFLYPIEDDSVTGVTNEMRKKYRILPAEQCIKNFNEKEETFKKGK
jgi:hypothetical protein